MRTDINRILRNDLRPAKYGAPMGDSGYHDLDAQTPLYCQRVRFTDYDYGPDGTYWGGGPGTLPLYCVFDKENTFRHYYRAPSRAHALDELYSDFLVTGRIIRRT